MKNPNAVALGRLSKGKKKTLSKAEISRRTKRLAQARQKRWPREKQFGVTVEAT